MKPDREGIWEWFGSEGVKRLVYVCDTNKKLREATGQAEPSLEVYWWGGYYPINETVEDLYNCKDELVQKGYVREAEWTDNWGNRVGDLHGDIPDEQLYLGPTPEMYKKIMEENAKPQ